MRASFFMNLENQDESFKIFFELHYFTIFFTFLPHIFKFCINQPHQLIKVIDKSKNQLAT